MTGEGSIQMCIQELSTCKQYGLPVKIVNLNNRYLGMVRQWQEIEYQKRYSESYMEALPDFVALARGLRARRHPHREHRTQVEGALRDAFGKYKDRLVFMDFITDQSENVWPMVQGGKGPDRDAPRCRRPLVREKTMKHIISVLLENEPGALVARRRACSPPAATTSSR